MPIYNAPTKDMLFILNDILAVSKYDDLPGYNEATPDLLSAILEEAAKFCEHELLPINQVGDREGCTHHEDGSVTTAPGFKAAYDKFVEAGWTGLTASPEYGGQGMPHVLGIVMEELMVSTNHSFAMYPGLTAGAAAAIEIDGTDEQRNLYLPPMTDGRWGGTMNLTEPHCGTDLGLLRTKAEPQADGSYSITGTKIFISSGDHDLTENIIHLVLARLPDAPKGVKGISLFIVPKINVNQDGTLGERNGVSCGSLEEKMGIHGNSTCVMNYDGATGYLLGDPHKGLKSMFIMMNAARLGVGVQGLAHSEVSYQNAVAYARDRLQGRSLTGPKNPEGNADPIIVHPDVRRMLLDSRSFNEPARLLACWCALKVDQSRHSTDPDTQQTAGDLAELLTPVIKGVFTDRGFENAVNAQQVFGGHGYIEESGMGQFVRDARIAQIYEGTNGIQALDLVGRKLGANGGRGIQALFVMIAEMVSAVKQDERIADLGDGLEKGSGRLQAATMWLMQNAMSNPDNAGAASTAYMHLFGHVILGHMWCWIAQTCSQKLAEGTTDEEFYKNKLIIARYYMKRRMPETGTLLKQIEAGSDEMMSLSADAF